MAVSFTGGNCNTSFSMTTGKGAVMQSNIRGKPTVKGNHGEHCSYSTISRHTKETCFSLHLAY